ncbi:MAG: twin-arginine translocation signal domain-containing protein, partial [Candidatus Hydrogenedentales bacterium]
MQTRRGFLKFTAAAGGALAVGPHALAQAAAPAAMAIARCTSSPQEAEAIQAMAVKLTTQAIEALGGMKRFVKSGDVVWMKPNMAWDRTPELAANTNPDVIATLVKLCFEAGA